MAATFRFGEQFTGSMATLTWTAGEGWHGHPRVVPFADLPLSPAMSGLHYGQVVFEGLKAYRRADGGAAVFRPDAHARRFQRSARRLAMPELPENLFLEAVDAFVRADGDALPTHSPELSLYLRPVLFASEASLALRPAKEFVFLLMGFVTGTFFGERKNPVSVFVNRESSRAGRGGTGSAKCAGNYAAAFVAQRAAADAGCDQVVWLDPVEKRWVEELGGMNLFFVRGSGDGATVVTPSLSDTLLPGITRDSLLTLARERGYAVAEEPVSVDQWLSECRAGRITETFACGTAALVTPVGRVRDGDREWLIGGNGQGPVTTELKEAISAVHQGRAVDRHGWMRSVDLGVSLTVE
jgi:branched-chain amino acid aminotransferase